jgi:hypothetical protein
VDAAGDGEQHVDGEQHRDAIEHGDRVTNADDDGDDGCNGITDRDEHALAAAEDAATVSAAGHLLFLQQQQSVLLHDVAREAEWHVPQQQLGDVLLTAVRGREAPARGHIDRALLRSEPGWGGGCIQCRAARRGHGAGDGDVHAAGERDECELLLSLIWDGIVRL